MASVKDTAPPLQDKPLYSSPEAKSAATEDLETQSSILKQLILCILILMDPFLLRIFYDFLVKSFLLPAFKQQRENGRQIHFKFWKHCNHKVPEFLNELIMHYINVIFINC